MGNRARGFELSEIEPCPGAPSPRDIIVVNMNDGVPCRR